MVFDSVLMSWMGWAFRLLGVGVVGEAAMVLSCEGVWGGICA